MSTDCPRIIACTDGDLEEGECTRGKEKRQGLNLFVRYVYQKAYVEFLCSPGHFAALEVELARRPAVTYHAVNLAGVSRSNHNGGVTALTWGVFPGTQREQRPVFPSDSLFQKAKRLFSPPSLILTCFRTIGRLCFVCLGFFFFFLF